MMTFASIFKPHSRRATVNFPHFSVSLARRVTESISVLLSHLRDGLFRGHGYTNQPFR
jgi:hypothetical protein